MVQPPGQLRRDVFERPSGKILIDVVADRFEFGRRQRFFQTDHAIAHLAVTRHHHHQHSAIGKRNQFDPVERRTRLRNRRRDADAVGHLGQHAGSVLDAFFHGIQPPEFGPQPLDLRRRQPPQAERFDVTPKRLFGGHAARRGMRLGKIALLVEIRHHIANGSTAQALMPSD